MSKIAAIIGRILLALLFIFSGANKIVDLAGTEQMISAAGLPNGLALPVALFEIIAGLCLALGFMVRLVSIVLIVFTAATILFFHNRFTDPIQGVMALKNLAIMGGLFLAFAHSQMWSHYYHIKTERHGELAVRKAEERAREAELRAARAEAVAENRPVTPTPAATYTDVDGDGVLERVTRRRRWFDW
ncbi:DoxX family protein [Novosphingobium aquimarinum]|uniref:DoxX family protein n=1 Tax=Novosphingobium aquimarinum TaxID=2682494 RepID=UPI0012EBFC3A|nr:DoxX family protein [Novosphingobium aquimarinum]